ncbi:YidH family protein [Blastomonas sp.]|uniref:YidH family protein n=1 Tax=Blastomonas sp. TaxID=1909299 RepID=UPI0035942BA5
MSNTDRNELAEDRTDLAEDRTVLAHERSFAGWLRTGMAAVGIGLGFNALFRAIEPTWAPKLIATVFLLIAIAIFVSAERRACAIISRLDAHHVASVKPMRIRLLAWALAGATAALIAAFWTLSSE